MGYVYIKNLGRGSVLRKMLAVVRDAEGRWIVSDDDGLVGGVFRERRDAVRFAAREPARVAHLAPAEVKRAVS